MHNIESKSLLIMFVLLLGGCSEPSKSELVGNYKARYHDIAFALELLPNGTFRQVVSSSNGQNLEASGRWNYRDGRWLELENAYQLDYYGNSQYLPRKFDSVTMRTMRALRGVTLTGNDDLSFFYRKQ